MRIGVDVDGVLANFNAAFIDRVVKEVGVDLFPPRPFDIPIWDYPQHYGYTEQQVSAVWESIKRDPHFWLGLQGYSWATDAITALLDRQDAGADIYFITSRPGYLAKQQTEDWLYSWSERNLERPTVLICSNKGAAAQALNLTVYIDDRWENVADVANAQPTCTVFLLNHPWNQQKTPPGVDRIYTFDAMWHLIDRPAATTAR